MTPADVKGIRRRGGRNVRQGGRAVGPADGGVTEWAADAARGGLPGSTDLREQLQRLRGSPEGRMDAVGFMSARMRRMAALRAGSTPRQWKLLSDVAGAPTLTTEQWRTAYRLLRDPTVVAAVTRETYELAIRIEDWWGQPTEAVGGGDCDGRL